MLDALLFTKTPSLLIAVYKECLWKVNSIDKTIYLTFDDGPVADVTPLVLDELKRWNAKATFFCIGKNVEANPGIFQQIINDGHAIGNHTYEHLNGWHTADAEYFENIAKCNEVLSEARSPKSGENTPQHFSERQFLFRPPYGKLKPSQYSILKSRYKLIMWDVLSFDFDLKMEKEKVLDNVLKNTERGSIIVFHDSLKAKEKVLYALPKVLEHFSQEGFKFEKLC